MSEYGDARLYGSNGDMVVMVMVIWSWYYGGHGHGDMVIMVASWYGGYGDMVVVMVMWLQCMAI